MQRFLKRRAVEDVDLNRDADTHAKVPPEKDDGLLRYMSTSSIASIEVAAAARNVVATGEEAAKTSSCIDCIYGLFTGGGSKTLINQLRECHRFMQSQRPYF